MQVVLSTLGKFHTFDLARELHARDLLRAVFTGYPRLKLRNERLPKELVRTFPWIHAPYIGALAHRRLLGRRTIQLWEYLDRITLDGYVSRRMPDCDVFVGLSSSALLSGKTARAQGAKYVCDRGSAHIRAQDRLLRDEHSIWGVPYEGIDPRIVEREEQEYAEADCITIPSKFAARSFAQAGVAPDKLRRLPYGVDISRFEQTARPDPGRFDVLFVGAMSLRKGVQYLMQAYGKVVHPAKSLRLVGDISRELIELLKSRSQWNSDTNVVGPLAQSALKHIMSKSHVLVLPSVEDGFGLVLAQAMACGCPVIGTNHTGAEDLLGTERRAGFVVPVRDVDALAKRLQQLADNAELRNEMSAAAIERVRQLGGWSVYGAEAVRIYQDLAAGEPARVSRGNGSNL